MRDTVKPTFVVKIERNLGDANLDPTVTDENWQQWLTTFPEVSVRLNRIHRKGTAGFDTDAFCAFGQQMIHGAHQLARLNYSMEMQDALADTKREVAQLKDPTRIGLIVKKIDRRHECTMNPKGARWSQAITSAAFIYYPAMTSTAELVNLTPTKIIGIPIVSTLNQGAGGLGQAAGQLNRALLDFTRGEGNIATSSRVPPDEKAAMAEADRRCTIDKSQSHDLAGVGETGVEYSATRNQVMGAISYFFHHTERMNRDITYLAAYRIAKLNGSEPKQATEKAADLTWRTHFDYQFSSRPRIIRGNSGRVRLVSEISK